VRGHLRDLLAGKGLRSCFRDAYETVHPGLHVETWGFPDPPEMTMSERFKARYRGVR